MTRKHTPVVVDLGCADHNGEWPSLEALAEEFKPDIIYGFDPSPTLKTSVRTVAGTPVRLQRKAAWTYDGTISFTDGFIPGRQSTIGVGRDDPSLGRIGVIGEGDIVAKCFDFSKWLKRKGPAAVKMDIEGAEYELLEKLLDDGTAGLMTELIIEWHDHQDDALITRLRHIGVAVNPWWM